MRFLFPGGRFPAILFALAFAALTLIGCGGKATVCKLTAINVSPLTATVDHTAAPPGNTEHFAAFAAAGTPGCAVPLSNLTNATWTVSDTANISISNVKDATNGTATCLGATTGAATVTATVPAGDGTTVSRSAALTYN